jgi:hypothetical protein
LQTRIAVRFKKDSNERKLAPSEHIETLFVLNRGHLLGNIFTNSQFIAAFPRFFEIVLFFHSRKIVILLKMASSLQTDLRGKLFESGEMDKLIIFKPESRRPPFLNPLSRGEARVFARSDSGFPLCYARFQNGVPRGEESGFEAGADTNTKPNKNSLL